MATSTLPVLDCTIPSAKEISSAQTEDREQIQEELGVGVAEPKSHERLEVGQAVPVRIDRRRTGQKKRPSGPLLSWTKRTPLSFALDCMWENRTPLSRVPTTNWGKLIGPLPKVCQELRAILKIRPRLNPV
jgi:hypothetical protein